MWWNTKKRVLSIYYEKLSKMAPDMFQISSSYFSQHDDVRLLFLCQFCEYFGDVDGLKGHHGVGWDFDVNPSVGTHCQGGPDGFLKTTYNNAFSIMILFLFFHHSRHRINTYVSTLLTFLLYVCQVAVESFTKLLLYACCMSKF